MKRLQSRTTRDDTADAAAFERLRLLETVLTHARDAVIITEATTGDGRHKIVYVNPAFTTVSGYAADEAIGKTPSMLHGPRTSELTRAKIRAALAAWQPIEIEVSNRRKDGTEHWVELSIVPVADESGWFTHWISVQRDVTSRKTHDLELLELESERRLRVEAQLTRSKYHDLTTGLHNRLSFMQRLKDAVIQAETKELSRFALLSIDIDGFRLINDSFGHRMGDALLREVAARLTRSTRTHDTLARMGGDEFSVLLEESDVGEATLVAERIVDSMRTSVSLRGVDASVSLSVGITTFSDARRDVETLLIDAGAAMSRAKADGGDCVMHFTDAMEVLATDASHELMLRSDLRTAIENDELRVHFQPIVDVARRRVGGFEALVRWQHPKRGLVSPLAFIPLAEETGLITKIDAWVLARACHMAARWQSLAPEPFVISVNVSSRELLDPQFIGRLHNVLVDSQLAPELLQLEITESVFLAGVDVIGPIFASVRALGVKIALDDFGTGYSSLSYLERFQVDVLKIDRSFVCRLSDASAKSEIVRAIVSLAHALGTKIVAEGVESHAQREALVALGCTHIQGYLFSKPVAECDVPALIASQWERSSTLARAFGDEPVCDTTLTTAQQAELDAQIDAAMLTHNSWIARLEHAVETGTSPYDVATVARHDVCPIGIWLARTMDPALKTSPLFVVTEARHAAFHRSAARLLALALARDPAARDSLAPGGDFTMVASHMLAALSDWRYAARVPVRATGTNG